MWVEGIRYCSTGARHLGAGKSVLVADIGEYLNIMEFSGSAGKLAGDVPLSQSIRRLPCAERLHSALLRT